MSIYRKQTQKDKKTIDAKLIKENTQKLKTIKKQQQQAWVTGTQEYNDIKLILSILIIR